MVEHAAEVCRAFDSCFGNASLARLMTHDRHRLIQRQPLMLVSAVPSSRRHWLLPPLAALACGRQVGAGI